MVADASENGRRLAPMVRNFFLATKFGSQLVGATLVFLACVGFFTYRLFTQQYAQIQEIFQVVDTSMQHELIFNDILINNAIAIGLCILAYIVLMVVLIIRANQKYAGPLVSILRSVEAISAGEYTHRIVIRKGDRLQDLVLSLNLMAETLEKRHGKTRRERDNKAGA